MAALKKRGSKKYGNAKGKRSNARKAALAPAVPPVHAVSAEKARLLEAKTYDFDVSFSQAVAVLMRAPNYRHLRVADLEWMVIPPLLAGQNKIALSHYGADGTVVPEALALWARVSPGVDLRLSENLDRPPVLEADEWTSGDINWLIVLAGEPALLATFLPDLRKSVFKDEPVKFRMQDADGKRAVAILDAGSANRTTV